MNRLASMSLAAAAAAVALVPLYGDPRQTPVTHAEWARMLVRGLGLEDMVRTSSRASQIFSTLSWKQSLSYAGDEYTRADGVDVAERAVVAQAIGGEVAYPVAIVRGGDYKLRLRLKGNPANPVLADITPIDETEPVKTFSIVPATITGWIEGGQTYLDPGGYSVSVILPAGTSLDYVELAPPCLSPIEPYGGWKPTSLALNEDVAVTVVKALDREWDLPPADVPVEVYGSEFQTVGATVMPAAAAGEQTLDEATWIRAGSDGLQAVVFVDVPKDGLYTLSVFGIEGGGQSWLSNACNKSVVCPSDIAVAAQGPEWRVLTTSELAAGRHFFAVTLADGAAIGRFRLEPKKSGPEDYIETMKRVCFDPGPAGEPITRDKAVDAMNCVRSRRAESPGLLCGDVTPPLAVLQASGTGAPMPQPPGVGPGPGPGTGPGPGGPGTTPPGGGGQPPLQPPALPPDVLPQPPGSPVVP